MARDRELVWSRLRWLPVGVALLGIALSVAGWSYLVSSRRAEIRSVSADIALQSRSAVASSVRSRIAALRNLAGFWAVVGQRPVAEWRADVEILIENFPNLVYVAWITPDGRRARVAASRHESPQDIEVQPLDAPALGSEPRLIGPETGESGAPTYRVLLPVRRGNADLGMLEARVNAQALLASALAESAPGYALRIEWNGVELFTRGEPSQARWQQWWREEGPIHLPLNAVWTAHHAPTPELAAAWLDPIPHYLLAMGIVLAIALGVLSHHLQASFQRAGFLAAGNEALEASTGELRRLNEALESRVQERTQELEAFTHSISHDLKSPLGAILNFAAILELDYRDQPLDDEGLEILRRIRTSAARGTELLEGLLRLTRAGRADLRLTRIDMTAQAREAFAMAKQSDPDPDVEFQLEPLPAAMGDRALVHDVLVNLLDNALKYTRGQEKRRVAVRGRVEGDHCLYEVEDNGRGFDMRHAAKLFGLFERLPSSRGIEGTGVGLALVERIVRRHDGTVSAEGRPGEGATFTFTLPAGIEP